MSVLLDVGSHKGTYTDLFIKNYKIKKAFIFEPQKKILNILKKSTVRKQKYFHLIMLYQIFKAKRNS